MSITDEQRRLAAILDEGNKPLNQFTKPELVNLVDIISKWRYYVGISNDINPSELVFMTEFLVNNYGNLTVPEINLAINLSLKGELNVDSKPYGNFSVLYVSTILNSYIDYKSKIIREISDNENIEYQKYLKSQSTPIPPPDQRVKDMRDILLDKYKTYKSDGVFNDPLFYIFNFIKKRGDFNKLSKEKLNKIKEDAEKISESQVLQSKYTSSKLSDIIIDKESNYLRIGRKLMLEAFFNTFSSEKEFVIYLETITEKDFYVDNSRKGI